MVQQIDLLKSYYEMEVKQAMFKIDSNKSPGPDRYGSGFFKSTWDIIGKDIIEAVLTFLNNGKLLRQLNTTNIALIPKVKVPESTSQYRPIAYCNILYKCISKLLSSRLKIAVNCGREPISFCAGEAYGA